MVKVAIISPLNHLNYSDYGDLHMFLTPLVKGDGRSEEYVNYCRQVDGYKIIDNGAFELEEDGVGLDFPQVISAAKECQVDEVILTDYLYDGEQTLRAVDESLDQLTNRGLLNDFTVQAVPQGTSLDEWMHCFDRLMEDDRVDVLGLSKLSVPRLTDAEEDPGYLFETRSQVLKQLAQQYEYDEKTLWKDGHEGASKRLHLLGGGPWLAKEVARANEYGFVRSVDSSMPVWYGINQHSIDVKTGRVDDLPDRVDLHFDGDLTETQRRTVMHNIATLQKFASKNNE